MDRWVTLRNLQEPFNWMVVSCVISSTMNSQRRTKIARMTPVMKLINKSGSFEDKVKFDWQPYLWGKVYVKCKNIKSKSKCKNELKNTYCQHLMWLILNMELRVGGK